MTFAFYTVWPTNAYTTPKSFVVGILGSDACAEVLRSAPDLIHDRKVVVKEFQGLEGTEQCQLLLVTEAKAGKLPEVLAHLKNASVLIVVEAGKTVRKEGMINLGKEKRVNKATNKEGEFYCFDVNETAAKQVGLTMTSNLKQHARSVF